MSLRSAAPALLAALLFGASTPLAKLLGLAMAPQLLAGLLYLGSGLGLAVLMLVRQALPRPVGAPAPQWRIPATDWPWLAAAILAGGVLGPVLLMAGLASTAAATAALLLNVEGVLTALIAWWVFHENADRQIVLGMAAILARAALLSLQPGAMGWSNGALLIAAACLCWAIDNNLTRKVAAQDALLLAGLKGLVAGISNTSLALMLGAKLPAGATLLASLALGFVGYGLSLVLFVLALRSLGTARTGAYFSVAPLFGVLVALLLWPQWPGAAFWLASGLMGLGLWLHLRERHAHAHVHEAMAHSHPHRHDAHHQHAHDFVWDGREPHVHAHQHAALAHSHAHHPDLHHQHRH